MKSTFILIIVILFSSTQMTKAQQSNNKVHNLLIGTYTKPDKNNGLYVYAFNSETGELSYRTEASGIKNPTFLAISSDNKFVYSVSEVGNGKGSISAFSFDAATGKLQFLNDSSSGGNGPCYVSVDNKSNFVFSGNYGGGSVAAIPIKEDGTLGSEVQSIQHEGKGIKENQDRPHVHAAVLSEDNRFLFVPDLGTDKVNIYKVDLTNSKPLTPADEAFVSVEAGNGPRHLIFHSNDKLAYLINEMTGNISVFDYEDGKLNPKQTVRPVPSDFTGKIDAADIHISPDNKFLYGSLRGDIDEIVIYAIDESGKLIYVGRQSTLGETPRNFAIDPSGNFLLVGNQESDSIIVFKRDQKTGLLEPTGTKLSVESPVCLIFAPIE